MSKKYNKKMNTFDLCPIRKHGPSTHVRELLSRWTTKLYCWDIVHFQVGECRNNFQDFNVYVYFISAMVILRFLSPPTN